MKITVIGAGYVGLVAAVCFACGGHQVVCLEKNEERCRNLAAGRCPILEEELPQMLTRALDEKRICFTMQTEAAISAGEIIFITVGTPSGKDGQPDLEGILTAAAEIGRYQNNLRIIVIKSTVPPGTTKKVEDMILATTLQRKNADMPKIICNPEFLREGTAIRDFLSPDRIVIGADDRSAANVLFELYRPLLRRPTVEIFTSPLNAELIKYASNSYLAVRLSFVNELAGLCEKLGGDISEVTNAMGQDQRIGSEYLSAGLGYGGACLPKDTQALAYVARTAGASLTVLESAMAANSAIAQRLVNKVAEYVAPGGLIALWGFSFKAGTEDFRNSPILLLMDELSKRLNCSFQIFDPANQKLSVCYPADILPLLRKTPEESVLGADAVMIGTAWPQFKEIDLLSLRPFMCGKQIFHFVNLLKKDIVQQAGFIYHGCGKA